MNLLTTMAVETGRKVLLVDDDPLQRKLLAKHLTEAGHVVTACAGPAEALAAAALEPPDVIVSDVLMDELDGFAFCRELREDATLGAVPVVLLSAHFDDVQDRALAEEVGASALLQRTPSVYPRIAAIVASLEPHPAGKPSARADIDLLHAARMRHQLVRLSNESATAKNRAEELLEQQARLLEEVQRMQGGETVGQLAAGVAHAFNNSLAVIFASTHMLLESIPPEDPRRIDVEDIQTAAERAAELSRRMLALARRREVRRSRPVELNGVVSRVSGMLGRILGRHIRLSLVLAPELDEIQADVGELEQVIVNLAVNARDAMLAGGMLEFTTENLAVSDVLPLGGLPPGEYVVLGVRDTGCGMDDATKARIFEPMFTTRPGATGLGLATCQDIVRGAAGRIEVSSTPGTGTLFRLYFPRHARAARGGETVLVVDDQVFLRTLIAKGLQRNGYNVLVAADREDAVRVIEAHPGTVDLVVSDWAFPHHNGMDVLLAVRDRVPEVRVIFVSGSPESPVPALPFLSKPFGTDELVTKIRSALGG